MCILARQRRIRLSGFTQIRTDCSSHPTGVVSLLARGDRAGKGALRDGGEIANAQLFSQRDAFLVGSQEGGAAAS